MKVEQPLCNVLQDFAIPAGSAPKQLAEQRSDGQESEWRQQVSAKLKGLTKEESKICEYTLAQDDAVVIAVKFGVTIKVKDLRRLEPGG